MLYVAILNMWHHVKGKIASGVAVRGDGDVAGEGRVVGVPKIRAINEYQLRFDVQHFLWPVYLFIYLHKSSNSHLRV